MTKKKILIQLDPDEQASVFDSVVAIDAGTEQLFRHEGVTVGQVQGLVHGAMFTRGPQDLHHTAIFVGGSNVGRGEQILEAVKSTFFGPLRVSVMLDANGANTTAAAAVLAAGRHVDLSKAEVLVLGGTGPVGQRAARLLAGARAAVRLGSRSVERAETACQSIRDRVSQAKLTAVATSHPEETAAAAEGVSVVIAAGAAGVELMDEVTLAKSDLKVAIDLNAVPPAGIGSIEVMDRDTERNGCHCYGAIGVGQDKMKIHKAAIASLFEANDHVLDAEEVYALGKQLLSS